MPGTAALNVRLPVQSQVSDATIEPESDRPDGAGDDVVVLEASQLNRDVGVVRGKRLAGEARVSLDQYAGMVGMQRRKAGREQVARDKLGAADAHHAFKAHVVSCDRMLDRECFSLD